MACSSTPDASGGPARKMESRDEFQELVERLRMEKATVVLRKLFIFRGNGPEPAQCSVVQEIWIKDKKNPDVTRNPLKSYAIVHVHHHSQARVEHVDNIKRESLEIVDAVNARHLAASGTQRCHSNNPFYDTFIEPSGQNTFKVFPPALEWTCNVPQCGQTNWQTSDSCRGKGFRCRGKRKCTIWKWKEEANHDPGLRLILEKSDALHGFWNPRNGKDRYRAAGSDSGWQVPTETFGLADLMRLTRRPRQDLRLQMCQQCSAVPCQESCPTWKDLRVAMLCVGINKYSHMNHLRNARGDAQALCEQTNALQGCRAEMLEPTSLKSPKAMANGIKHFLNREGLTKTPPKLVLIVYSGHGMQKDGIVYLLPEDADPDHKPLIPAREFVALPEIFELFGEFDRHARRMDPAREVTFVIVIDACRDPGRDMGLSSVSTTCSLDPKSDQAPPKWAICFSCSQQSTAMDGAPGDRSPFAKALLCPESGIFAEGMPLKKALDNACQQLRRAAGAAGQAPVTVGTNTLADELCIYPQTAGKDVYAGACEMVTASAVSAPFDELKSFYEELKLLQFLPEIRKKMRVENLDNLIAAYKFDGLETLEINGTNTGWVNHTILEAIALFMSLASVAQDKELSRAGTPFMQSPRGTEVVCMYNEGDPDELRQHVKTLLEVFNAEIAFGGIYNYNAPNSVNDSTKLSDQAMCADPLEDAGHWTFCMLLWSVFVAGAIFPKEIADQWKQLLQTNSNQEDLLPKINEFIDTGKIEGHLLMETIKKIVEKDQHRNSRPVAAIAVIDSMVKEHLSEGEKHEWTTNVIQPWYDSSDLHTDDVLLRANNFVRDLEGGFGGIKILLKAFETGSYVVFMTMSSLASLLLFQLLELRNLRFVQSGKAEDAGSSQAAEPLLHGFQLFASSEGGVFHATDADRPARNMPIIQGLRCLAHLRDSDWETLGPVKTAREFLQEEQCVEQDELLARALTKTEDGWETTPGGCSGTDLGGGPERKKREKLKKILEVDACNLYLQRLCGRSSFSVGYYVDSASGDERQVGPESIALVLVPCKSFNDKCRENVDLMCPISRRIMQEPVKVADGTTYERAAIERWAKIKPSSPLTRIPLTVDGQLQCTPNVDILERIEKLKKEKLAELEHLKQTAEGEDERRILCNRYGVNLEDSDSKERVIGQHIDSATVFLERMVSQGAQSIPLACLTGPPASGKTITMQQIVYVAAEACSAQMKEGIDVKSTKRMPLLPVFMRAAVLSKLIENGDADDEVTTLRQLVALFVDHGIAQMIFPHAAKILILELFDLDQVLICIDGLDEAAEHQELVICIVELAVTEAIQQSRKLHVLLSTRKHSYVHSCACLRLGGFSVVNLQPLDDDLGLQMLRGRLPTEKIVIFQEQLAEISRKNPELARSPFLLSLVIEVFKKDGAIPRKRVKLYSKQVEAIVSRCITNRIDGTFEVRTAQKLATKYLETLAFVCQLRLEERDFTLADCQGHMRELWGADQPESLSESEKNLFKRPIIGLLTGVGKNPEGNEAYRFNHLTLQEYLAAKCAVRLYGHDVGQLLSTLQPLHSRWKREVLLFTGCLLQPETVFEDFCRAVLRSDDGTGVCCEMVRDFSKERGESTEVAQLVRNKLQKIRGTKALIAGLCHPSLELRSRVLSEMDTFGMPHDPFSETDGTVEALKTIAQRHDAKWYERAAAILSTIQIAQMEHCQKGDNRTETLRWLLEMLTCDVDENVHYALVKGLGTLLKGQKDEAHSFHTDFVFVSADDEKVLLRALKLSDPEASPSGVLMEAVADLNVCSDGLMDWALSKSHRIAEGDWPIRHVLGVFCTKIATDGDYTRAVLLAGHLFARVHAGSSKKFVTEKVDLHKGLKMMFAIIGADALIGADRLQLVLPLLQSGEVLQRVRVIEMAADLEMNFAHESLDTLAFCLLTKIDAEAGTTDQSVLVGIPDQSLLDALMLHERLRFDLYADSKPFETCQVLRFLLDMFKLLAQDDGNPQQVVMQLQLAVFNQSREEETLHRELEGPRQRSSRANSTLPLDPEQKETPASEIKEDIQRVSLLTLANVVTIFNPQMLKNPYNLNTNPLSCIELYCAARLWADTGLIQLDSDISINTGKYISKCLALSDAQSVRYTDAFSVITVPWNSEYSEMENDRWDKAVLKLMQDKMLGRIFFKHVLSLIGQRQGAMAVIEMKTFESDIQQWQPSDATGQLEKQFLLKELRIGKRSQQFPTWTGLVSAQTQTIKPHYTRGGVGNSGMWTKRGVGKTTNALMLHTLMSKDFV